MSEVPRGKNGKKSELEQLLARRSQLLDLQSTGQIGVAGSGGNPGDLANDERECEVQAALLERNAQELRRINAAIEALQSGSRELCEQCGNRIAKERLQALLGVRNCINCARKAEQNGSGVESSVRQHWSRVREETDRDHLEAADMID